MWHVGINSVSTSTCAFLVMLIQWQHSLFPLWTSNIENCNTASLHWTDQLCLHQVFTLSQSNQHELISAGSTQWTNSRTALITLARVKHMHWIKAIECPPIRWIVNFLLAYKNFIRVYYVLLSYISQCYSMILFQSINSHCIGCWLGLMNYSFH